MQIPLNLWNISLWLAVSAIILLITTQLISAYEGNATIMIDQRKLKIAAVIMGILFLATMAIRIYGIITSP